MRNRWRTIAAMNTFAAQWCVCRSSRPALTKSERCTTDAYASLIFCPYRGAYGSWNPPPLSEQERPVVGEQIAQRLAQDRRARAALVEPADGAAGHGCAAIPHGCAPQRRAAH